MVLPDIVRKKKFKTSIETNNKQNLGMLLFDYRNISDEEKNIDIAVDIDVDAFIHWFKSLIC
jgi:inosine-uridine nucleoside N-ribohydrolase